MSLLALRAFYRSCKGSVVPNVWSIQHLLAALESKSRMPETPEVILDRLRQMTVDPMSSQYQTNYRPMPVGLRQKLWREGYECRNRRKMQGFKHSKLEWKQIESNRFGNIKSSFEKEA